MFDEIVMDKNSMLGAINPYIFIPITSRQIDKARLSLTESFSWITSFLEYFDDTEKSYIDSLKLLLKKKYTFDEINELVEFFMYRYEHSMPIYYDMLPKCFQKKVTLIEPMTKRLENFHTIPERTRRLPPVRLRHEYISDEEAGDY
jgi:hypothetical protein